MRMKKQKSPGPGPNPKYVSYNEGIEWRRALPSRALVTYSRWWLGFVLKHFVARSCWRRYYATRRDVFRVLSNEIDALGRWVGVPGSKYEWTDPEEGRLYGGTPEPANDLVVRVQREVEAEHLTPPPWEM